MYEDLLEEGDRISLANLSIGRSIDMMLSLNITKKSILKVKTRNFAADEVLS
jgi:hypothetical protein